MSILSGEGPCRSCALFRGGSIDPSGYRIIWMKGRRILEHRHLMERKLGRKLNSEEQVHHINGNRIDNRLENLTLKLKSKHGAGISFEDAIVWVIQNWGTVPTKLKRKLRKLL